MLSPAILALNQLFSKPFRTVLWKMLGITLLLLLLTGIGMQAGLEYLLSMESFLPGWAETGASILAGLGLFFRAWLSHHSRIGHCRRALC